MDRVITGLQAQLFTAVTGESSFEDAISFLAQSFGAVEGVVFELNRKTGEITNWASQTLRFGEDDYSHHVNSINPRMHFSMAHSPGHVVFENRFISEDGIRRHEFYDWLGVNFDLKLFLGARLYDDGDVSVFHSIEFGKSAPHPDETAIRLFQSSAKSVGDAWRLAKRHGRHARDQSPWAPDHLPWSIIALNADGSIHAANVLGLRSLASQTFLKDEAGQVVASHRSLRPAFDGALSSALLGNRRELLLKSAENQSAIMQIIPVPALPGMGNTVPAVQLFLWDASATDMGIAKALATLWGLSPPEVQLVIALHSGWNLNAASEHLGISRNTARNHLQSIFSKMAVNRQSDMLRMTARLLMR